MFAPVIPGPAVGGGNPPSDVALTGVVDALGFGADDGSDLVTLLGPVVEVVARGVGFVDGGVDATAGVFLAVVLVEAVSLPMKKAPTASTRTTVPIPICR